MTAPLDSRYFEIREEQSTNIDSIKEPLSRELGVALVLLQQVATAARHRKECSLIVGFDSQHDSQLAGQLRAMSDVHGMC
jgi:hypothetical protein